MPRQDELSKRKVRIAGENIASLGRNVDQKSLDILNEWRNLHNAPLCDLLLQVDDFCTDVQSYVCMARIKRAESIIEKLRRPNYNFKLHNLDDIAAFRIIVPTVKEAYQVSNAIESSCDLSSTRDYIAVPKQNGYRSIHHVIKMHHKGFNLKIEVQIRTLKQHAWASLIEFIDMTVGLDLKTRPSSMVCEDDYSQFMLELSKAIETGESIRIPLDLYFEISAMKDAGYVKVEETQPEGFCYYLVIMDKDQQIAFLDKVDDESLMNALVTYNNEQPTFSENEKDAVLVRTDKPMEICNYYPTQCMNTRFIIEELDHLYRAEW